MLSTPKNLFDAIRIITQFPTQMVFFLNPAERWAGIGLVDWDYLVCVTEEEPNTPVYGLAQQSQAPAPIDGYKVDKAAFVYYLQQKAYLRDLTKAHDFFNSLAGESRSFIQCSAKDMGYLAQGANLLVLRANQQADEATDETTKQGFLRQAAEFETLYNRVMYQYKVSF